MDKDRLLRVKGKLNRPFCKEFPILLCKDSNLTALIIKSLHIKLGHCRFYRILSEFRNRFFVQKIFFTVNSISKTNMNPLEYFPDFKLQLHSIYNAKTSYDVEVVNGFFKFKRWDALSYPSTK